MVVEDGKDRGMTTRPHIAPLLLSGRKSRGKRGHPLPFRMAKKESWPPLPVRLSEEVDRLFDELIYRLWGFSRAREEGWNPQIDLCETDTGYFMPEFPAKLAEMDTLLKSVEEKKPVRA